MSDIFEQLISYFQRSPRHVVSAYLFGSHAREAAHRDSDVDVAVLFDRDSLPERRQRSELAISMSSDLIAATHCNNVDVVSLNDAGPVLAQRVFEEGRRLYCADDERDRRFRLATQLRYIDLVPFLRRTRALKLGALRS